MRSTFNKICCSNDDDLIQPLKLSINEQVNKIVQLSEEKKKLEKINKNLNSEINKLKASNENNGTFSPPTLPSSSRKYYNATKSNQNDTDETHSEENVQSNEIDDKNINETIAEDNNAYEIQINNNNENITETKSIDDETHTEDNDEKEIETKNIIEKESKDNEIETNTYNNE